MPDRRVFEIQTVLAEALYHLHQFCAENLSYKGTIGLNGVVTLSTDIRSAVMNFYTNSGKLTGEIFALLKDSEDHLQGSTLRLT